MTFANQLAFNQWYAGRPKNGAQTKVEAKKIEQITKVENNKQPKEIPSVTYGFNRGMSHMYANPVEQEAVEDAQYSAEESEDDIVRFIRSKLATQFHK